VVGHQFPGESVGELEIIHYNSHRLASVSALEDSLLWAIRKPNLEDLITKYPIIMRKLFYNISERLSQADRKIAYLAFMDSRLRMVNLILDLYNNIGEQTNNHLLINWKVTQQHMANMIGVNRESAARALQELQAEGVIQIHNKRIIINDFPKLKQIANDNNPIGTREWHTTNKYHISINS
jgi:CRP/FNR family transcriptional regulator